MDMTKKSNENASVGKEVLGRLKRFTEKIQALNGPGELPDVLTVRQVKLDLRPRSFNAAEVKAIRDKLRVSQGVLADFLGVSVSTVQDWEQGLTVVQGPACRILEEMLRDIEAWRDRIHQQATATTD
jgi:DNA-binding transcriptional regulator YiaG